MAPRASIDANSDANGGDMKGDTSMTVRCLCHVLAQRKDAVDEAE